MKFKLEIELGNDAMQKPADVADRLRVVAFRLETHGFDDPWPTIMDVNGNTVGRWRVK